MRTRHISGALCIPGGDDVDAADISEICCLVISHFVKLQVETLDSGAAAPSEPVGAETLEELFGFLAYFFATFSSPPLSVALLSRPASASSPLVFFFVSPFIVEHVFTRLDPPLSVLMVLAVGLAGRRDIYLNVIFFVPPVVKSVQINTI